LIDGVGTTFCNGSIDAWGVDALDQAGYRGAKDRLFWRLSQLMNLGFMLSAIVGAYVANHDIAWPWLCGATGYLLNAVLVARLMSDGVRRQVTIRLGGLPRLIARRVRDGIRTGLRMRTLMLLTLANGVYFAAWAPYWLEWPQFFNDHYGVGIWVVGWLYALFTVSRMIGAELMIRTAGSRLSRADRLCGLAIALAVLMFLGGSAGGRTNLTLVLFCLLNAAMGAVLPFAQSWINEEISADQRATLLSFRSTFETLGGSIGLLGTGIVADWAGIPRAWQLAGLISLAALPCYLALRRPAKAVTSRLEVQTN
jgi:predicted MFS family arabinose efflux permease